MEISGILIGAGLLLLAEVIIFLFYRLISGRNAKDSLSEDQLKDLVQESHEQGVLLATEADMIQNIFDFDEKDAKDIMVHRKEIVAIDGNTSFGSVLSFVNENHFSRYPVYLEDLENIIGILHLKDLLKNIELGTDENTILKDIPNLLRPVEFVPETHGIHTLITRMQSQKYQMVIVVDEYGQTSGLLSMEDILEEIVGNIFDEYDEEEESISKVTESTFRMEGRTPLEEAAKTLGIEDLEGMEFETLNGLITAIYGKVPAEGENFTVNAYGFDFHVLDVKQRMAQTVMVRRHPLETSEPKW